jgi:hypothetical protein
MSTLSDLWEMHQEIDDAIRAARAEVAVLLQTFGMTSAHVGNYTYIATVGPCAAMDEATAADAAAHARQSDDQLERVLQRLGQLPAQAPTPDQQSPEERGTHV